MLDSLCPLLLFRNVRFLLFKIPFLFRVQCACFYADFFVAAVNNVHTPSQTPPQQQHQQQQQHSTSISQTITQQTSGQQHHSQQMSLISPPSQIQQVSLCTQQKQSGNLAIGSLPPGISDPSNSMRNIPLTSAGIYAPSCNTSTALRGPHVAVYQNTHSMENGLLSNSSHHQSPQQQHTRGLPGQANAGTARYSILRDE